MAYSDENSFQPRVICTKGDMLLSEIQIPSSYNKAYNLQFEFNNLNPSKVNVDTLLSTAIYDLLEKVNVELIEKIYILNSKAFFIDPTPEITPAGKEKKKDRVIMRSVGRSYCDYVLVMSNYIKSYYI